MKISIDTEGHTTYVRLTKKKIVSTEEVGNYIIDYDKDGNVVGIEYLNEPFIEIDGIYGTLKVNKETI
jgi:uncharacterized protein YuzE